MYQDGISVIICCYNSADRLPDTLLYLSKQIFSGNWEVIVVDNCSTDNTAQLAGDLKQRFGFSAGFSIVSAPIPGLNNARQKGVNEAKYKYLLFCDDDNWLQEDYLTIAYSIMEQNSLIGALGGACIAAHAPGTLIPDWFLQFQNNYAVGSQASHSGDVTERKYVWGAGMVINRAAFDECVNAEFPLLLVDRSGKELSSGGDTELCLRLIISGRRLYYDERLKLYHYIPAERLTVNYRDKLLNGIDAAHSTLMKYYKIIDINSGSFAQKLSDAVKTIVKMIFSPIVKRWNAHLEKQWFYLYTNIDIGADKETKVLKKFNDRFIKSAA